MSESKHTPGPWHVHDGDRRFFFVDSQTIGSVCKIATNEHDEANARLIAAAPELLEALRGMIELESHTHRLPGSLNAEWVAGITAAAKDAIAKAEGRVR